MGNVSSAFHSCFVANFIYHYITSHAVLLSNLTRVNDRAIKRQVKFGADKCRHPHPGNNTLDFTCKMMGTMLIVVSQDLRITTDTSMKTPAQGIVVVKKHIKY